MNIAENDVQFVSRTEINQIRTNNKTEYDRTNQTGIKFDEDEEINNLGKNYY